MNPAEEASRAMETMYASIERGENFLLEAGPGAGKTWGLVKALRRLIARGQTSMPRRRQKIACITFTNVAKEEIETRTEQNPLVYCDTIHGFCWSMISGFQKQLREELRLLPGWQEKLDEAGVKTVGVVEYLLGHRRVEGENVAVNHDDVLQLTVALLGRKKFCRILAERFPVILIDEYQDANAGLMAALQKNVFGEGHPQIGLFGDHWQKIYGDGCGRVQHQALREIGLGANFRSCPVIVTCLNRMRPALPQEVKDPDVLGSVVIMHTNHWPQSRRGGNHWMGDLPQEAASEAFARAKVHLSAQGWSWDGDTTKILMLTHRALAAEQGYGTLPGVFARNDSFAKKENEHVKFLVDVLDSACDAFEAKKYGEMFSILGQKNPLIKDQGEKALWSSTMQKLCSLRATASVGAVLSHLRTVKRPRLPDSVMDWELELLEGMLDGAGELPGRLKELKELHGVPYSEVKALRKYLEGHSPFETKHGVKGAEFENVLVVVGRGWNLYNFGEMLELAPAADGLTGRKLEGFERNRNLFYVACSRAKRRLAVLFTQLLSDGAMTTLQKWFGSSVVRELDR